MAFSGEDTLEDNHVDKGMSKSDSPSVISSSSMLDITSNLVLSPPPPSYFVGYALPPGHPCNSFTLPPPPADPKRTGPRRKF